jgi:hypothetical protein
MAIKKLLGLVTALLFAVSLHADQIALAPDHPERYVVVKGDTLWDISGRFLQQPWLWPEVWYVNPQIENPHLIYPGDVISLVYVDGKPQLRLERGHPTVKLSPTAREEHLDQAIHTIPIDAIRQFLTQPLVVDQDELSTAPYLLAAADEHVVAGAGDRIYVRGVADEAARDFSLYRTGGEYQDPDSGELLGYKAQYIGDARLNAFADVSTMTLVRTTREARAGDRLRPVTEDEIHTHFTPRAPSQPIEGRIIDVVDGVTQIGQYQVVAINRGSREGIEVGHVLAIYQAGSMVADPTSANRRELVQLPDEHGGELMIFRVFDKVSFGLIMKATRPLHILDFVRNP